MLEFSDSGSLLEEDGWSSMQRCNPNCFVFLLINPMVSVPRHPIQATPRPTGFLILKISGPHRILTLNLKSGDLMMFDNRLPSINFSANDDSVYTVHCTVCVCGVIRLVMLRLAVLQAEFESQLSTRETERKLVRISAGLCIYACLYEPLHLC